MSELQRLESLLSRVQENRAKPRSAAGASVLGIAQPSADFAEEEVSFADAAPSMPPTAVAEDKPKVVGRVATPLERAFEGELEAQAAQAPSRPVAVPAPRPKSAPGTAEKLIVPAPPRPSKPIAQASSTAPGMDEVTFGELLRRSLSLRPR